ncbi:MAG: aminotransferase class I/II-fold pyridoxal phosphate-dependent enzyme [Spirochaetes bacterium]|nr:aminotransferase class I/II-fold pyridoxal phosphate-dependent enzyme [Spirochaetota bacterium]
MIYLDKNENQYGPSEKCRELLSNVTLEMFNSYSRGYPKMITGRLEKEFGVPAENILLGYGAEDILKQVIYFFVKEGEKVLLPLQSWWYYTAIAKELDAQRLYYNLVENRKYFDFHIDELLEEMKKEHPKIVLICSPNNPTGNSIKMRHLKKIMKLSQKTDSVVVLDEAYWGFNSSNNKSLRLTQDYDNILILRTFSKLYALAGVRIGFAFIGKGLQNLAQFNKRYLGYNRISEELTFAALDSKPYYKHIARLIEKDKKRYYHEMEKLGIKVFRSEGNFILLKVPPQYMKPLKYEFEKEGVVVKFYNEEIFKNYIRISVGTTDQNDVVIDIFKDVINKVNQGIEVEWTD